MNNLICSIFEISTVLQYDQIQKNQKSKKTKKKKEKNTIFIQCPKYCRGWSVGKIVGKQTNLILLIIAIDNGTTIHDICHVIHVSLQENFMYDKRM